MVKKMPKGKKTMIKKKKKNEVSCNRPKITQDIESNCFKISLLLNIYLKTLRRESKIENLISSGKNIWVLIPQKALCLLLEETMKKTTQPFPSRNSNQVNYFHTGKQIAIIWENLLSTVGIKYYGLSERWKIKLPSQPNFYYVEFVLFSVYFTHYS